MILQNNTITLHQLGLRPYSPVSDAMHQFTEQRDTQTGNEIWLVEHERVFTQGQAGKAEHVLAPGDIPVIQSDRGGQVTYHGPGQQVMYVMIDLKRDKIGVRELVSALENTVVETLKQWNIDAYPRLDALVCMWAVIKFVPSGCVSVTGAPFTDWRSILIWILNLFTGLIPVATPVWQ